ncbi:Leucine rich repeat containing protein BspA family protein [Entamoeba marina]
MDAIPKPKFTDIHLQKICEHLLTIRDITNLVQTSRAHRQLLESFETNPHSEAQLFPNITTQTLYTWNDIQLPTVKSYTIAYKETYLHYYLKYFAIRDKIHANHVEYSRDDRLNYECMHGPGVLPPLITHLSDKCFEDCGNLTALTLPTTIRSVGRSCFAHCTALKKIVFSSNIRYIGDSCFLACTALKTISIPNNYFPCTTSYGISLILSRYNITCQRIEYTIDDRQRYGTKIPDTPTALSDRCFAASLSLTSVIIPTNITSLGNDCFAQCKALKSISLPSTIKCFNHCFSGCSCLTSLTLPDTFPCITTDFFDNLSLIRSVVITDATEYHGIVSCTIANIIERTGVYCTNIIYTKEDRKAGGDAVPKRVFALSDECFANDYHLKSLTIPKSVLQLGNKCFYNCTSLTTITLPSNVTHIPYACFAQCSLLKSIKCKCKKMTYGVGCFYGCSKLKMKKAPPICFQSVE